ncbi:hypothetical protein DL765_001545 [Monosporascus sp. GIB2]|nr:hypothetical protein DL765_001545 [Monosporascus sp. GIB2]
MDPTPPPYFHNHRLMQQLLRIMQNPDHASDQLCAVMNYFLITGHKAVAQDGRDGAHSAKETRLKRPRSDGVSDSDGSMKRHGSNDPFASGGSDGDGFGDEVEPVYRDASETSRISSRGLTPRMSPSKAPSPPAFARARHSRSAREQIRDSVHGPEGDSKGCQTTDLDIFIQRRAAGQTHLCPHRAALPLRKSSRCGRRNTFTNASIYTASVANSPQKGISVIVDTLPSVRPDVHRKLRDVMKVIAPIYGDRPKSLQDAPGFRAAWRARRESQNQA